MVKVGGSEVKIAWKQGEPVILVVSVFFNGEEILEPVFIDDLESVLEKMKRERRRMYDL